jgi:hypothetical protein
MSKHVALLGDSVFDNSAYTRGEPDVVTHLRALLPEPWRASLHAVDGATTAAVERQVRTLPADASHLVLSVGGNDALANIDLLHTPVASTAEALALFERRILAFQRSYRAAVEGVLASGRPTVLCTIYNGQLADEREARHARMALMMFNDVILGTAFALGLTVIELRSVCSQASDYANPIEPSGSGGAKIARAIRHALGLSGEGGPVSRVISR